MTISMFVNFGDAIKGECEDKGHEGWCEITALEQDFENKVSPLAPRKKDSKGAVKCDHSEIDITKVVDSASALLMNACWLGETLDEVVIECFRAYAGKDGVSKPINYFSITLKKVVIRELEYSVGEGDLASEDLKLVYNSAAYLYHQMDHENGTVTKRAGTASRTVGSGNWKD